MKEKYTKYIQQQLNNPAIKNQYKKLASLPLGEFNSIDPLGEDNYEVIKGLIHKYDNRALIKVSYKCAAHCQFCTRIRQIGSPDGDLSIEDINRIGKYINAHNEITDVILSGGDPFYTPKQTTQLLKLLTEIDNVRVIRIGTRLPIHNPQSFHSSSIINLLEIIKDIQQVKPVVILIHVEHPDELTIEALEVIKQLKNTNAILLSQTVFLKDINDDYQILHTLFEELFWNNVVPYYIYRCDYVKGLEHFVCDIEKEVEIMTKLRKNLSGIACPTYIVDVEGKGKIPVPLNFWEIKTNYELTDYDDKKITL
jgi:lysine 2,3-aminomutase